MVAELAIVGMACKAVAGGGGSPGTTFGVRWLDAHRGDAHGAALDRTYDAGPSPHVYVDVRDADVTVDGGSGSAVSAVETVHVVGLVTGMTALHAERTADGVRITEPGASPTRFELGLLDRRLHLTVPSGARVEIANAADIAIAGLRTAVTARTRSGAIHVRDQRGDVDVETANGRIELTDVQGGRIEASSSNGRLVLARVAADRLDASAANGRVEAHDLRVVDGGVSASNGSVRLAFATDSDAIVTARTGHGHVHVSGLEADASDDPASRVVHLGSGRGRFEVSAGNGSITLSQGAQV
ncbi:MAG TPA: DUF4097 family beta strand repeat-containing protein [Candidatus Baltobacteraceae bacterium]|nr:DUF4097 family beta strand repeat-containing protein [Candidatus Baltobacteraceae bacterium]